MLMDEQPLSFFLTPFEKGRVESALFGIPSKEYTQPLLRFTGEVSLFCYPFT